jgi:hypothetical protein
MSALAQLAKIGVKGTDALVDALRSAKKFVAPQDEALALAQQRAALPVEKGGLGLPANNTAADRAKAMGFDTDVYHATNAGELSSLKAGQGTLGNAVYTSKMPEKTDFFAKLQNMKRQKEGLEPLPISIYPLKTNAKNTLEFVDDLPINKIDTASIPYDSVSYSRPGMSELAITNPDQIRSRFAAFDPWRKTAATAATMGVAAPDLLAQELRKK